MVILCYHIPLRSGTARNMAAVKALLSGTRGAHISWRRTPHYNENFINTDADGLCRHIRRTLRVFWHSALNRRRR